MFVKMSKLNVHETGLLPVYLDCNATSPLEPAVRDVLIHFLTQDFGNEGSRTHEYGARAKRAVQDARDKIAAVVRANREDVVFTSGATESNNLAILGLRPYALESGKRHIITSAVEHKAVLEPCEALERDGFTVTRLPVSKMGCVDPEELREALRPDTVLVTIMQANNETGVRQPLEAICDLLREHPAFFHTDAAQGFGKDIEVLQDPRLDLISISAHKIYGPKGVGALINRRRGYSRPPLHPVMYGGGQERKLRPGTLPVAPIAALGLAAELSLRDHVERRTICQRMKGSALRAFASLNPQITGDPSLVMDHVLNIAFPGLDSEALMVGLKDLIAVSNGSACTSSSYEPSHVLRAMGMRDEDANRCVRISWCHLTPSVDWDAVAARIRLLS